MTSLKEQSVFEMKVLFVSSWGKRGELSPFTQKQAEMLGKKGVDLCHFEVSEAADGFLGYWRATKRLRLYLKEHPVELIHAHYSYCGWVADLARSNEKLVVSYLGSDIYGYPGQNRTKKIFAHIKRILTCLHARFRVDLCLVMSERMRQLCRLMGDSIVFPHGVDFEQYYPIDRNQARKVLDWPLDKPIILFPANPKRLVKNFPLAEQAVSQLRRSDVQIKVFGNVPEEQMKYYYNAADVLLMTSLHEGSPCSVKEAMACNLPIVSTDVGDVKDIISGSVGCSVCNSDPDELAEAVSLVLKDCRRSNGREKMAHLNAEIVAQTQIGHYQKLLAVSGSKGVKK